MLTTPLNRSRLLKPQMSVLLAIGVGAANYGARERRQFANIAVRLVWRYDAPPCVGSSNGTAGKDCAYETKRAKPGMKAGAIENVHKRLGILDSRTYTSTILTADKMLWNEPFQNNRPHWKVCAPNRHRVIRQTHIKTL